MSTLRVAMVGCGLIAPQHLEGYKRSCGRAVVVALIDTKEENATLFAQEVGGSPKVGTNVCSCNPFFWEIC